MKKGLVLFLVMLLCTCFAESTLAIWGRGESESKEGAKETRKEERVLPKKAELDTNADGNIDRIEYYTRGGVILRIENDTDKDGLFDEKLYYENGKLIKATKDTNKDGKEDTWLSY